MKKTVLSSLALAACGALALAGDLPTGWLKVNNAWKADGHMVVKGETVRLDWKMEAPVRVVTEVVDRGVDNEFTTLRETEFSIRVLGVGFGANTNPYPVEGYVKIDNGSWVKFFSGNWSHVVPTKVAYSVPNLPEGSKVYFKMQGFQKEEWYNTTVNKKSVKKFNYTIPQSYISSGGTAPSISWNTGSTGAQEQFSTDKKYTYSKKQVYPIMSLFHDEAIPAADAPAFDQGAIASYLTGYVVPIPGQPGKTKASLPNPATDFILLPELTTDLAKQGKGDKQDLCVLVSFKTTERQVPAVTP